MSANHILHAYGSISGSGNLSLNGYGLVSLYASNAFTGDTRPLRGTLSLKNTNALQNSTLDLDGAGSGTLNLNNLNVILGGLKGSRPLALGSAGLSVGNNNQNTAFSGTLSGSGPLTKLGVGALALSGSNTYSGGTFINAGTLTVSNSTGSATGTGPVTVAPGATLSGPGSLLGPVSVSGTIAPGTAIGALTTGPQTWNGGGVLCLGGKQPDQQQRLGPPHHQRVAKYRRDAHRQIPAPGPLPHPGFGSLAPFKASITNPITPGPSPPPPAGLPLLIRLHSPWIRHGFPTRWRAALSPSSKVATLSC